MSAFYGYFPPLPAVPTYLGACRCPNREWIMAIGRGGRCPHCGTGINRKEDAQ